MVSASRLTTLLALLIAMIGVLPIMGWVEPFPKAVFAVGLLIGLLQELRGVRQIRNWQFNLLLLPVFGWYLLQYSRTNPIQPVVSVLVIMLAARLCGEKSNRNLLQISLLALFCLASRSLYDLSPAFLFWLGLLLLLTPILLVLLTFHSQNSQLQLNRDEVVRLVAAALLITLLSIPAMALLFPILPRTPFPLWNFMSPARGETRGLSDKVDPGRADAGATLKGLAFRAELPRQPEPPYWRGIVFNRLAGNSWVRSPAVPPEEVLFSDHQVTQTIYPEPGSSKLLIGLDAPVEVYHLRVRLTPDLIHELPRAPSRRVGYTLSSDPTGLLRTEGAINRQFYLQLPDSVDPRFHELAATIRRQAHSDTERLALAEQLFRASGFRYSRTGLPTGKDALQQFMFVSKKGHCEFFASGFGILLRAAGLPTRLVGGYLGGEYNQLGGYYLVAEDRAHVWVEAWLEGKGWLRIDPTRFAVNAQELLGDQRGPGLALRLRMLFDALEYRWNRSVVTYDFDQQVRHLKAAGSRLQRLEQAVSRRHLFLLLAIAGLAGLLYLFRNRLSVPWQSQEKRLVRRFRGLLLKRYGIDMAADNLGLIEAAKASNDPALLQAAELLGEALYGGRRLGPDEIRQLELLFAEHRAT